MALLDCGALMRTLIFIALLLSPCIALAQFGRVSGTSGAFTVQAPLNSALAQLVATMNAGDLEQLTTVNMLPVITQAAGNIGFFATDMGWDSASHKLFFVGASHGQPPRFVEYDEATNTWTHLADPYWFPSGLHGYDHSEVDLSRSEFYHMPYFNRTGYRYDIATDTWSALTTVPDGLAGYWRTTSGVAWFPEMDALIVYNAPGVIKYSRASNTWSLIEYIADDLGWQGLVGEVWVPQPDAGWSTIAEYNPVHGVVLFGAGVYGPRKIFKLDAAGTITQLADAPIDLQITASSTVLTVDPVSGDYIVVTTDRDLYSYDITTDTWTLLDTGIPLPTGANTSTIAAPIPDYGVIFFASSFQSSVSQAWIYKHAE